MALDEAAARCPAIDGMALDEAAALAARGGAASAATASGPCSTEAGSTEAGAAEACGISAASSTNTALAHSGLCMCCSMVRRSSSAAASARRRLAASSSVTSGNFQTTFSPSRRKAALAMSRVPGEMPTNTSSLVWSSYSRSNQPLSPKSGRWRNVARHQLVAASASSCSSPSGSHQTST